MGRKGEHTTMGFQQGVPSAIDKLEFALRWDPWEDLYL